MWWCLFWNSCLTNYIDKNIKEYTHYSSVQLCFYWQYIKCTCTTLLLFFYFIRFSSSSETKCYIVWLIDEKQGTFLTFWKKLDTPSMQPNSYNVSFSICTEGAKEMPHCLLNPALPAKAERLLWLWIYGLFIILIWKVFASHGITDSLTCFSWSFQLLGWFLRYCYAEFRESVQYCVSLPQWDLWVAFSDLFWVNIFSISSAVLCCRGKKMQLK